MAPNFDLLVFPLPNGSFFFSMCVCSHRSENWPGAWMITFTSSAGFVPIVGHRGQWDGILRREPHVNESLNGPNASKIVTISC